MNNPLYYLACLSILDGKRDELDEEYGDLPEKVSEEKKKVDDLEALVADTQRIIKEVKKFSKDSKVTIQELKGREEKLAKQQFSVRNNKEFDAITKEIEHSRNEYTRLTDELRTVGVKEENLQKTLEQQKMDLVVAKKELIAIEEELSVISSDQNEEVKEIIKAREGILKNLSKADYAEYKRIRTFHKDAVVRIKKTSCTGCYSHVPPQKIVEIRNSLDKMYTCEHCGRILYPEDIEIDKHILSL